MGGPTGLTLAAIGLGVAYCAAPGVVNTESVRRGLSHGFRPALLVQLGALIGDLAWAALALSGLAVLAQSAWLRLPLGFAGAFFLLRFAWGALRTARSGSPEPATAAGRGAFATGAIFSLANPVGLAFWAGVGGGVAGTGGDGSGAERYAAFLASFAVGALVWCLGLSALVACGRRFVAPALFRWVDAASAVVLGWFGVRLLWNTVKDAR